MRVVAPGKKIEGVRYQRHAPAAAYPRERHGTHCTGGWVGLRAGLDRCGKSRPSPGFDPRTTNPSTRSKTCPTDTLSAMWSHRLAWGPTPFSAATDQRLTARVRVRLFILVISVASCVVILQQFYYNDTTCITSAKLKIWQHVSGTRSHHQANNRTTFCYIQWICTVWDYEFIHSFFQYSVWRQVQSLLQTMPPLSENIYTGCHRRNGPNFGRVFFMLNYTDITQNTYIQSWTVTEKMAREVWNFDSCYTLTDCQIHIETGRNMWFL